MKRTCLALLALFHRPKSQSLWVKIENYCNTDHTQIFNKSSRKINTLFPWGGYKKSCKTQKENTEKVSKQTMLPN